MLETTHDRIATSSYVDLGADRRIQATLKLTVRRRNGNSTTIVIQNPPAFRNTQVAKQLLYLVQTDVRPYQTIDYHPTANSNIQQHT